MPDLTYYQDTDGSLGIHVMYNVFDPARENARHLKLEVFCRVLVLPRPAV
jgi:hypothetical protein